MTGLADPFETARLRERVLDAWAASPSRFREDANAEEDYALGGYRDRVIVELAQNAADAAVRAGVPGRLRLTLANGVLTALNAGAPLDGAGVEALSTLRASSKRGDSAGGTPGATRIASATGVSEAAGAAGVLEGPQATADTGSAGAAETVWSAAAGETVGRFGVGFAAVVAVSDSPRIRSATGLVTWSRERTRALVAAIPALADEVAARSGHVPVLRLPFADLTATDVASPGSANRLADAQPGRPRPSELGDAGQPTVERDAVFGPDGTPAGSTDPDRTVPDRTVPSHTVPGAAVALPDGFATAVELPLRDEAAVALVRRLLAETGPALLLALPALTQVEITVDGATRLLTAVREDGWSTVTVNGAPSAWRVASAGGELDPALLADRPAEERGRTAWSVRWAVPVGPVPVGTMPLSAVPSIRTAPSLSAAPPVSATAPSAGKVPDTAAAGPGGSAAPGAGHGRGTPAVDGGVAGPGTQGTEHRADEAPGEPTGRLPDGVAGVVHAPTPTDEPLSLPALLLASFPLSPDRRHVAPGPLTDFLIERAADAYAALLPGLAPGPGLLDLVPGPVGRGELDARLASAIVARLPEVPFLPAVADGLGTSSDGSAAAGPRGTESAAERNHAADHQTEALLDAGRPERAAAPDGAREHSEPPSRSSRPGGESPSEQDSSGQSGRVRPRDAVLLGTGAGGAGTARLAQWLAPVLPNLVDGPARHPAWAVLGVRRMPLAELADLLASLDREPAWWHGLYAALADGPPEERAELGALPVPLADGRVVRGPRGLLLPAAGLSGAGPSGPGLSDAGLSDAGLSGAGPSGAGGLAVLGLRIVDPEAAHPLLVRLGAIEATPRSALENPVTVAAVAASYDRAAEAYYDDDSPQRVADAVLGLVAAVDAEPGEYPWLADLALPGEDGDWYPAGELLLPGAPLQAVLAADAPFGIIRQDFAERYDAKTLAAAGVASTFGLLRAEDVELDESAVDLDLDGAEDWAAASRAAAGSRAPAALAARPGPDLTGLDLSSGLPPVAVEVVAVRDLDLVDPDRWPQALELLAQPPLRAALTEPVRVRRADGSRTDIPSYTAWWLREHVTLNGQRPSDLLLPGADPLLAGLYTEIETGDGDARSQAARRADAANREQGSRLEQSGDAGKTGLSPARLLGDTAIARALGVRSSLRDLLAEPGGADELLARLADPTRPVTRPQLRALWSALAATAGLTPDSVNPPDRVRAVQGDKVTVADAGDVLILDAPDLWPLAAGHPLILAPYQHAARLADLLDLPLASEELSGSIESAGERSPMPAIFGEVLPGAPTTYVEHDRLTVDGADLPWRYLDGELHAATAEGLAHGLAWAAGQWHARHLLVALLLSPEETARLLAESDLDSH